MTPSWIAYFLAPIYALFPQRWRFADRHTSARFMSRAAVVSGLAEAGATLLVLRLWFMKFFEILGDRYTQNAFTTNDGRWFAPELVGQAGFLAFAANPLTWFILYFGVEGVLRAVAALTSGEVCGILPLCALDWGFRLVMPRRKPVELALVRDEVLPGDASCDIRIASCRQRPDWKYPFTIRYEGAYLQVISLGVMNRGPRPYVYSLRRLPAGEIARGLRDYHPDDVLVPVMRIEPIG
ncbi:MAG: hypothetical protein LAN36_16135 [Acidobacteriia bacterium]|nr:hypothetical protein [Terriglobia bacterium]